MYWLPLLSLSSLTTKRLLAQSPPLEFAFYQFLAENPVEKTGSRLLVVGCGSAHSHGLLTDAVREGIVSRLQVVALEDL